MIQAKFLDHHISIRELLFLLGVIINCFPFMSPPLALLTGVLMALLVGHPYIHLNHKATNLLLQVSVVALGFGMNFNAAIKTGKTGIVCTVASIAATLLAGFILCRVLKIDAKASWLITVGTAICGGSAIAAVAPAIKAEEKQISVALGIVFLLNAVALFVFPVLGSVFHLSQTQFGWWSAIAIHDTSSVTGAAARYGSQSLEVATTVKLTRALWIVPVTLMSSLFFRTGKQMVKIPWFIGLFILAMLLNTYVPAVHEHAATVTTFAHSGFCCTLFLIGSSFSKKALQQVGVRPLMQGVLLWLFIAVGTLCVIKNM